MNETPVTVVGNVASELRVRRFGPDDDRVVGFRIASSERRWDRDTQSWVDGDRFTAWVTCWRRLGDGVVRSLVKGDPVVVAGRLSVREYEADGQRRFSTEIAASAVGPDLSRSVATVARRRLAAVPDAASPDGTGPAVGPVADDDADRTGASTRAVGVAGTLSGGGRVLEEEDDDLDEAHTLVDTHADPVPSVG